MTGYLGGWLARRLVGQAVGYLTWWVDGLVVLVCLLWLDGFEVGGYWVAM